MPEINAIKDYSPYTYYHVYNRGINKQDVFLEKEDYLLFLYLIDRYMSNTMYFNTNNKPYRKFTDKLDVVAYCLMSNHYHLLLYTKEDPRLMETFMRMHQTAFVASYNKRQNRVGHLFQGRYKAAKLENEAHKSRILDYIHMNPGPSYEKYPFSSYQSYINPAHRPNWLIF